MNGQQINYLAALREELSDIENVRQSRNHARTRRDGDGAPASGERVSGEFDRALVTFGLMLAICTSLANDMAGRATRSTASARLLRDLVPASFERAEGAALRLSSIEGDPAYAAAMDALEVRLALARTLTEAWSQTPDDATRLSICASPIADAWRRTCLATIALAHIIEPDADASAGCQQESSLANTCALLASAGRGERPCIDRDGMLSVPGWAERRREFRTPTQVDTVVQVGGHSFAATMTDISSGGAQFVSTTKVIAGSDFALVGNGTTYVSGIVRWHGNDAFGVSWTTPLSDVDAFVGGLPAS